MRDSFAPRPVKPAILGDVLSIVRGNSQPQKKPELRKQTIIENLMLRQYLSTPEISYSRCLALVAPLCPEYQIDETFIRGRAGALSMTERTVRGELTAWARNTVESVYLGMTGDGSAIQTIYNWIENDRSGRRRRKSVRHRLLLLGMFEWIPQLRTAAEYDALLQFGEHYSIRCLNQIISTLFFDTSSVEEKQKLFGNDVELLRKELFLARKELADYRELAEAADAEMAANLEELKNREITSFFARLNDRHYGYLIDSAVSLLRTYQQLEQKGVSIPYELGSTPMVLRSLIGFLRDAGVSPATPYPPQSLQHLTLQQMEGACFEADPLREKATAGDQAVTVRVLSSGWNYRDRTIAPPVFQECSREE